jgi:hypothetical protein
MTAVVEPAKRKRILRLLSLACVGAGCLTYIQNEIPLKDFLWDFAWLLYLGLVEWIGEPLWKQIKFWKRLLWGLSVAAVVIAATLGLLRLARQNGVNESYLAFLPWFLCGSGLLVWSLLIRDERLPD